MFDMAKSLLGEDGIDMLKHLSLILGPGSDLSPDIIELLNKFNNPPSDRNQDRGTSSYLPVHLISLRVHLISLRVHLISLRVNLICLRVNLICLRVNLICLPVRLIYRPVCSTCPSGTITE